MGLPRLKVLAAAVVAAAMGLTMVSCSGDDPPPDKPAPSAPAGADGSSMTFDEAYRKVPMNGTAKLPISWELAGVPDVDDVLAARRSLAYSYWLYQEADWTSAIPLGKYVFTDRYYTKVLAPFATTSADSDPSVGPIWAKVMNVEKTGVDRSVVTFCTDVGYWHRASEKNPGVRKERGEVESYEMENVQTGDGGMRWLADRRLDPDPDRKAEYGAACADWAQHKP
ncbi:hypothetical protein [Actinoplanes sp. HUAS TT8]|uniref:hypothetical protein n=1 Tax=Actinoplanes sp. HUAS TT8 TaxID=3447453 RepID=UPI003F51FD14